MDKSILEKYSWINEEQTSVILQMVRIGQAERVFEGFEDEKNFRELLDKLLLIEHFYREIGGIAGYHNQIIDLMKGSNHERFSKAIFHAPAFIDISKKTDEVDEAVKWGLEAMPQMAEIYPLGGAADRLHLIEEATGKELPAAKLHFAGRPLLEHLIRDLEAREHLYYQTYGKKIVTPIAIMTSYEKNNHAHILEIFERFDYFGRPKDSIRFFTQPLVPTVNSKGEWCMAGPLKPVLKPGGHGVIWKLARDAGIFKWLENQGKKKCLVRQINNPVAGLDYGLLAFIGIGWKKEMVFGFASAPRLLKAAEGVNVLIEKEEHVVLTNIEYCDFAKFGIQDVPMQEGEPYSRFSSNTNILFADLGAISKAVDDCPFPGLLINMKMGSYACDSGEKKEEEMARLESTMQNIADVFVEKKGRELKTEKTFVTYNLRHKTISTAKKAFILGKAAQETPENCFYDLLFAHRELLSTCGFELPKRKCFEEYINSGPEFLFLYHPALGPLYSAIKEKLKGGRLHLGSEWILEAGSNVLIKNLDLKGSLQIIAEQPFNHKGCVLENVSIENEGVDWIRSNSFWKMKNDRRETVKIVLNGESRFIAQNVCLRGNRCFIVEDGETLEI